MLRPLLPETRRAIFGDRLAVAEPAALNERMVSLRWFVPSSSQAFEADGIAKADEVHADVAREQHISWTQEQRNLLCTMPRNISDLDTSSTPRVLPWMKLWRSASWAMGMADRLLST